MSLVVSYGDIEMKFVTMTVLLPLCLLALLTSCSRRPVVIVECPIPLASLSATAAPPKPEGNVTWGDIGELLIEYQASLKSCNADKALVLEELKNER